MHIYFSGPAYDFITGQGRHFTIEGLGIFFSLLGLYFVLKRLFQPESLKSKPYYFFRFVIAGMLFILLYSIILFFTALLAPGFYKVTVQYYLWMFDACFLLYIGYKLLVSPKILKTDAAGYSPR
ncbi:MAG: hypothetical protein LAT67_12380 [Balneolales bacterium]|nr:hypothetical protein [Balneolales bacterium]